MRRSILLVFTFLFAITAWAADTGFYGRVTDNSTGQPVPNAVIEYYRASGSTAQSLGVVFSDVNGNYAIRSIVAGSYYARAYSRSGHVTQLYANHPCTECDVIAGTEIRVQPETMTTGLISFFNPAAGLPASSSTQRQPLLWQITSSRSSLPTATG